MKAAILLCLALAAATAVAGEVVPAINVIRDDDGVIRRRPPHCGPDAEVIHHPKYGDLCAYKEGAWRVVGKGAKAKAGEPCLRRDVVATGEAGETLSCQRMHWYPASDHKLGDACKEVTITLDRSGTVLLCKKRKYVVAPEKPPVASYELLPVKGNVLGDVRKVQAMSVRVVWNGEGWVWVAKSDKDS